MYDIQTKNDMLTGASLIITMPEEDIDIKALYTIQESKPEFIIPFCTRHIDGNIEIVYQMKSLCKLIYIAGAYKTKEYIDLWEKVLNPLLICEDWFMKTQAFVCDFEYIYYSKEHKRISYIYIPTVKNFYGFADLKDMAEEFAKKLLVLDMTLENKVLRSIMKDFNPEDFIMMLKRHEYEPVPPELVPPEPVIAKNIKVYDTSAFATTKGENKDDTEPYDSAESDYSETEFIKIKKDACVLRLTGNTALPKLINVQIADGGIFTIGRYDATVGVKQSSFEFERRTKAVSRRHAAIKRNRNAYEITDLSSSAGTFLDGQKLPPGTPVELKNGVRISFGTSGADYIWEMQE